MAETVPEIFRHTISYGKAEAILTKDSGEWLPISSDEVYRRVGKLFAAVRAAGVDSGAKCALLSENRWEWAVTDFALACGGAVNVPLYPTLPAEQLQYMLEHSECVVCFVSSEAQLEKIQQIWPKLPSLRGVVVFDPLGEEAAKDERVTHLGALIGEEVLTESEKATFEESMNGVAAEDLATIIYTSGTTGVPKGVMLSHSNLASNVRDCGFDLRSEDVGLSFLPLSHVAERLADYAYYYNGMTVAYAESIDALAQNMREVRPTIALAVPRVFEKIHARVLAAIADAPATRRSLFHWAIGVGKKMTPYRLEQRAAPLGLRMQMAIADGLVLKKLRGRLGGRIRFMVSGAAPLSSHLAEFFFAAGIPILEAYGQTETSPVISANELDSIGFGTVGAVIRNVEVKIADDGEILVRGPNVMMGYYKMPEKTAETVVDGWLATGDIGKFDEAGRLVITDRKKDLFKTAGGKYIAPQPIENALKTSNYIANAVVIAESRRFPSALIIPDFDQVRRWAEGNNVDAASDAALADDQRVQDMLMQEAESACADMARFEKVKKIAVLPRELTLENEELTPSMKVRRKVVEEHFAEAIETIYR